MKGVFEKKESFGIISFITQDFQAFPPLFHPHCEVICVLRGELSVTVSGEERRLSEGEGAFIFPYVTHSYQEAKGAEVAVILFDPKITYFDALLTSHRPKTPFVSDVASLLSVMERICRLNKSHDKVLMNGAVGYLNGVIAELSSRLVLEKCDPDENDVSKRILEYCSEHYCEDISIKSVSEALFISQSYVSRVFAKKLCYGFREYINLLRIERAKRLLATTDEPVLDVMLECGFKNQSSFNRIFREIVGVSPKQYRKNEN